MPEKPHDHGVKNEGWSLLPGNERGVAYLEEDYNVPQEKQVESGEMEDVYCVCDSSGVIFRWGNHM